MENLEVKNEVPENVIVSDREPMQVEGDAPGSSEDAAGLRAMEHDQAMQDAEAEVAPSEEEVIEPSLEPIQGEAIVADSEPTQADADVPDLHTQEMGEDMAHNETVLADVASDDVTRVLNEKLRTEVPDGQRKFGMLNPAHRVFWKGKDLVGNEYEGSGDNPSQCNVDAGLMGSCTCHLRPNPSYIAPPTPELPPVQDSQSAAFNNAYAAGWADADSAYQDLKTLILAWVADQMLSSSAASSQDTDSISFVQYVRHSR